jgi:hypothetical protein
MFLDAALVVAASGAITTNLLSSIGGHLVTLGLRKAISPRIAHNVKSGAIVAPLFPCVIYRLHAHHLPYFELDIDGRHHDTVFAYL